MDKVTGEELQQEAARDSAHDPTVNLDGVDWDAVAAAHNDHARRVHGWDAPRILPPLWEEMDRSDDGSARYFARTLKLMTILSCCIENDGRAWLHLSVSHQARIPRWTELAEAKRVFIGDREAYQIMPPKERYVNINARVLHVFALLDGDALPDFTRGTGSL